MPTVDAIKIDGLRDFQAALKALDGESQKQLRLVFNESATVVAAGAKHIMPRRSGTAAGSVRAQSGQRTAVVKAGGARASYVGWLDFGGAVGRNRSVRRPFLAKGRFIYPTYNRRKAWVLVSLEKGLTKLIRDSGLELD